MTKPITHGTVSGYVHRKCRCEDCRRARSAYCKARAYRPTLPRSTPCLLPDGTEVESQVAAAEALGVSVHAIHYHLNKYGHLNNIGKFQGIVPRCSAPKSMLVGQHEWPSLAALARHIGVSRRTLNKWLAADDMERLFAAVARADARLAAQTKARAA